MNADLSKRIKEIALELVAQKSIVETDDEVTMTNMEDSNEILAVIREVDG